MDLIDDTPISNQPEYTVSELSGAVKRVIEGEFGLVRVRGEVGRVSRPASGHLYFDLKDDRSVIAAISWKGQVAKMQARPEEGMEVIATGRMTTFPGQSKYQLIVDDIAPAGAGALMAMLEKRRAALGAEGLFDPARKQPIPYLPQVIGVITSPSGAVIRDILHRLRDRFPRHVLLWPVAVQGQACAAEVAAAIRGFNAIEPGGPIPRPDLLIVARGGGSLEDLWGFNEEIVVRAAAASRIPLISAVGHETDTTLIDFAADLRAPTPTAAAELAVPVRLDLIGAIEGFGARISAALGQTFGRKRQRLGDLGRGLPRLERLMDLPRQRLDAAGGRLGSGLLAAVAARRAEFLSAVLRPEALMRVVERGRARLDQAGARGEDRLARGMAAREMALDKWASRLAPAYHRLSSDAERRAREGRAQLARLSERLDTAAGAVPVRGEERLSALERMLVSLGYTRTLARGFAVVRADGAIVTGQAMASRAARLEIEFHDGRVEVASDAAILAPAVAPRKPKDGPKGGGDQGSLF